jgi:integrase
MAIKKVKKSVTEKEYKLLISHTKGDDSLKLFNRTKLLRIFTLLYFSGMRVNELSQIKFKHIDEILKNGETTITTHKTKDERILYFSDKGKKEIRKYFNDPGAQTDDYMICSWGNAKNPHHEISLINLVNKYMKKVLGNGFTSHSFRQGILTEMAMMGINTKVMQEFIGHKSSNTTLRYVKPTAKDVKNALVR